MSKQHELMGTEKVSKLLFSFSLPAVAGMFVNALYNIVDRIYIGNIKEVGNLAIAGVGVVFPLMIISFAFALMAGLGTATNISINLGQKKKELAEKYLGVSTVFGTVIGIVLTIITIFALPKIVYFLGASEKSAVYAKEYMTIISLGFPIIIVGYLTNAAIRSDGKPKFSMITLLIGAVLNIILDPIFIFGLNMGVKGAAIATVISQAISAVWTIYYFNSKHSIIKYRRKNIHWDKQIIKSICVVGAGPFALQIGQSFVFFLLNTTLKRLGGDMAVAAMTIVNSIVTFLIMPVFGINQGLQPIAGYNYGAKKYDRVKDALKTAILAATFITTLGFVIIQIFSKYLILVFSKNPELIDLSSTGLRIFTLMLPIVGFQIVSAVYFQAVGKPKTNLLLSLSRQILFLAPILLIFSSLWGINGVWIAAPSSDFLAFLLTFIYIKKEMNILKNSEAIKIVG